LEPDFLSLFWVLPEVFWFSFRCRAAPDSRPLFSASKPTLFVYWFLFSNFNPSRCLFFVEQLRSLFFFQRPPRELALIERVNSLVLVSICRYPFFFVEDVFPPNPSPNGPPTPMTSRVPFDSIAWGCIFRLFSLLSSFQPTDPADFRATNISRPTGVTRYLSGSSRLSGEWSKPPQNSFFYLPLFQSETLPDSSPCVSVTFRPRPTRDRFPSIVSISSFHYLTFFFVLD